MNTEYISFSNDGKNKNVIFTSKYVIKIVKKNFNGIKELLILNQLLNTDIIPFTKLYYSTKNIDELLFDFVKSDQDLISFFDSQLETFSVDSKEVETLLKMDGTFLIVSKRLNSSVEQLLASGQIKNKEKELIMLILYKLNQLHLRHIFHGDIKFENILYEWVTPVSEKLEIVLVNIPSDKGFSFVNTLPLKIYLTDFEWAYSDHGKEPGMGILNPAYQNERNNSERPWISKLTDNPNSVYKYGNIYHGFDLLEEYKKTNKYARLYAIDILALIYVSLLYNKFDSGIKNIFSKFFVNFNILSLDHSLSTRLIDYESVSEKRLAKVISISI